MIRKIMLLGEIEVGKTSIANRLVFDRFSESYKSTIGGDIYHYRIEDGPGGEPFHFTIWDTDGHAGEAMFREQHMKGAHAAIVVGDLTRRETLLTQVELLQKFSDAFPGRYVAAVLNKTDLRDEVAAETGYLPSALDGSRWPVHQTSAKSGENVKATFAEAATTIVRRAL
ncbi:MAG: GTP-binding protein [Alphaproteobacteria bacterium]|nr:GTP-binding protein [Alphaproteobacteria bacterium]